MASSERVAVCRTCGEPLFFFPLPSFGPALARLSFAALFTPAICALISGILSEDLPVLPAQPETLVFGGPRITSYSKSGTWRRVFGGQFPR